MNSRRLFMLVTLGVMLAAGLARANWLGNVRIEEPSHSYLPNGDRLEVTFDYKVTNPDGARFWVRPQYGGADVAGHAWSGSSLYPVGSGTATSWFVFRGRRRHGAASGPAKLARWRAIFKSGEGGRVGPGGPPAAPAAAA